MVKKMGRKGKERWGGWIASALITAPYRPKNWLKDINNLIITTIIKF